MKVYFTNLGCFRNLVDSEIMLGFLQKEGFQVTLNLKDAHFVIVNTCGFLKEAREEAIATIKDLILRKRKSAKLIVAGCMVGMYMPLLRRMFADIHFYVSSGDIEKIVYAIRSKEKGEFTSKRSYLGSADTPRIISTPKNYAYLKIAEGCRKKCSYCIIPQIKGPLKSKPIEQVVYEFKNFLSKGIFEIILIAQDLGDYGKDLRLKNGLLVLLREILKIKGDFWLRLLYLYPEEVNDELIKIIQSDSRICPYVDMPIQHVNNRILQAMNRRTTKEGIIEIIGKFRKISDMVIRTSLMVGFPGETEEDFQELLQFIKDYHLDNIGIFTFSSEKGAKAKNFPRHIPERIKKMRKTILAKEQLKIINLKNRKQIGRKYEVFVEGYHPDSRLLMVARSKYQCPDVDGSIIINNTTRVKEFGRKYRVKITDVLDYDLVGKVL